VVARLQVPAVDCQTVLESFPPTLLPELQGFQLKGTFQVDLKLDVDYRDLAAVQLGGRVGINRCRVAKAIESASAERLKQPFEQIVEPTPGHSRAFVVGPDNPDFTPYAEISKHVVGAVLTTEDAGFFRHRGFIPSQFRNALARNLKQGGFRLGASTISMQTVKNLLLGHEKTLSRKLQELFLTWYLEQHLSKQRILEIYFNVIEFGPGIYGIGRAARHYFGKSASEITALEAAFFSSILPSPKRRYTLYCKGALSPQWARYLQRIVTRMHERGRLDDEEYQQALAQQLVFDRQEAIPEGQCLELVKRVTARVEEEAVGPEENGNGAAAPAQAGEDRRPATKSAGGRGLQHRTAKGQRRKVR
jgi:membrane peptidoglycan carboxypeptidase